MSLQAFKIVFLTLGIVALAIWFIRATNAGRMCNTGRFESFIQIIDRKKIMPKVDLVAISFADQKILVGISGETIAILARSPEPRKVDQKESSSTALKEYR